MAMSILRGLPGRKRRVDVVGWVGGVVVEGRGVDRLRVCLVDMILSLSEVSPWTIVRYTLSDPIFLSMAVRVKLLS